MMLTRDEWNPQQLLSVAELIIDPATNGGTALPVDSRDVTPVMPDSPALAVFEGDRAIFVIGLWPYDPQTRRGVLHVAGTRKLKEAWKVGQLFVEALQGVDIMTLTDSPALIRLARRIGLFPWYEQNGYTVLRRANAETP